MRIAHLSHTLFRTTAALLTVAGLLAGLGMRSAAAQSLTAPVLLDVKGTSPTTIVITFRDTSEGEFKFQFFCYRIGGPECPSGAYSTTYALPGRDSTMTVTIPELEPDTGYCFNARAYISEQSFGPKSGTYCGRTLAVVVTPPPTPELSVVRITNEEAGEQTATQAAGISKVYQVVIRNDGVRLAAPVKLELRIATGGMLTLHEVVDDGGFTCAWQGGPLTCTGRLGGQGDAVQQLIAVVRVRVLATAPGPGSLTATVDPRNQVTENDETNNDKTLTVTVSGASTAPKPNLQVSSISGPKARRTGESGAYEVTVTNAGKGDAGPTDLVVSFSGPLTLEHLRLPSICTGTATELRCNGIAALDSGQTTTIRFEARAGQQVGMGQLAARVNPSGSVSESDSADNQRVFSVTVGE